MKAYEVHGLIRRGPQFNTGRIDHSCVDPHEHETRLFLHYADLTDPSSLFSHLPAVLPDEVGSLGAQSRVKVEEGLAVTIAAYRAAQIEASQPEVSA